LLLRPAFSLKGKEDIMGRITDNRADIYQEITDQMIAMIEAGTRPWSKSWNGSTAPNIPLRSTGVPYRGINVLTLWVAAMTKGYGSPHWLTFKQALALGGCVRKGEKGSTVVYANKIEVDADKGGKSSEDGKRQVAFLKRYTVFNSEQIDGIEAKYPTPAPIITATNPDERDAELDALFARIPVTLKHFGSQPYYQPSGDHVVMPEFADFHTSDDYYSTLASLIHDARFRARSGHLLRLAVLRGRPASLAFVSPHSD
jgi:antirestriction protein ArdC